MPHAAIAPGLDERAGVDARESAISRLEQASPGDCEQRRLVSNAILRRAVKAWRAGDIARAGKLSLQATTSDETNAQAYHLLAMCLERMGHRYKALVTYERAFQLDPDDPDLFINLGLTAWALKLTDGAVDMFRRFIAAKPASPLGYNNLGTILCEMGDTEQAIELLRDAIRRMPQEAVLWNSLATVLAESGRADESIVFYEEAIRLAPGFARPWHNLGFAYCHIGALDKAIDGYDSALARAVDPTEIIEGTHSRSVCMMGLGRLEEGFREYEIRNSPRFRGYVQHMVKAPVWQGEPLDGKRLLVVGEQGLGDEFMFSNILPDLIDAVGAEGRLEVALDPRLVSLFQRSFPSAEIGPYDDRRLIANEGAQEVRFIHWATPDFFATMGTPLQYYRKRIEDFPKRAMILPDPGRVDTFRNCLARLGHGPFVGICWRSMMQDIKRQKYFTALGGWGPLFATQGVTFVNVQYGDCHEELERARTEHGIDIKILDDLDLKNDIEGAAALSAALDLVISAPTAAAAIAASVGTEVWFLTAGRTWPQLGTDHFPWYANTRVLSPKKFGDWNELMPRAAHELAAYVAKNRRVSAPCKA